MHAIELSQVTYAYPESLPAIEGIDLQIPMGKKVAILGPNGAGKSTLLHHFNGLKQPTHGEVRVLQMPLTRKYLKRIRQRVGLVFQDPDDQVFSPTVWEDVQFGPRHLGMSEADIEETCRSALGNVGMLEHRDKQPTQLSYGQKKRVAIAGILAMKPDIVVMDEPMAYLDPQGQDEIAALLQGLNFMGKTIIVTTHDVDFAASWADMVVLMKDGKVLTTGGPELLVDENWILEAKLHLPKVARVFRMLNYVLPSLEVKIPKNEQEGFRLLYEILRKEYTREDLKEMI